MNYEQIIHNILSKPSYSPLEVRLMDQYLFSFENCNIYVQCHGDGYLFDGI